jgi:ribokinase
MYDVITVGSSTVDAFAKVESELVKIKTVHHTEELIAYPSGSKILISDLVFLSGGGGTNTAVCMSKLGLKVAYLGKIGNDANSKMIIRDLRDNKVRFMGINAKGISGYSIILDSIEGDRTILAYKGVNDTLDFREINTKKLKAKWFYFSSMVKKSYETLEKLAVFASKNNINLAFNPSNYLAEKGSLYLKEVISRTTLLVLNKEEAMLIGGKFEIPELIKELMKLGPKMVVITDGKRGAYTIFEKYIYHAIPRELKATETTGAGDAFASSFLTGLVKGKKIDFALKMAIRTSESVIMAQGAKKGLLEYKDLLKSMKKIPPKVVKKKI